MIENYIYHYYLILSDDLVMNNKKKTQFYTIVYISIILIFSLTSLYLILTINNINLYKITGLLICQIITIILAQRYLQKINSDEYIKNHLKKYPNHDVTIPLNSKERNFWIEKQKRYEFKIVKHKIYNELKNNAKIDIKVKESYDFLKTRLSDIYLNQNSVLYDTYIDTSNTFKKSINITLSILLLLFIHIIKFPKLNLDLNILPKVVISLFLSALSIYTLLSFVKDFLLSIDSISKKSIKQLLSLIDEIYNEH